MIHLMKRKMLFFILSSLIIIPGFIFIPLGGLKFGIDFTGGALLEYKFEKNPQINSLKKYGQIQESGKNTYIIKSKPQEGEKLNQTRENIKKEFGNFEIRREENVGPVIGKELTRKAIWGISLSCLMIVLYITYSFRKVPKPASSFRFGVAAVVALIHDCLVLIGSFAILGYFFSIEVDTLFVTALLTVIGFSVHDTIVVFDRIRENMPKNLNSSFSQIADISITQTLARSLNTSFTVLIVLFALLLFGGETIRYFILALFIGIASGTYSSIFNATALLCFWEEKLGH